MSAQEPRDILMTGMFDMHNFGDLMFPLIAQRRLENLGVRLRVVSATGKRPDLADACESIGFADVLSAGLNVSGVLIGGGYIVHTHRMDILREYRGQGVGAWCAAASWLGATQLGALYDVPVVWNAPGAPHPLRPKVGALAARAFAAADYFSLRDTGSRRVLGAAASGARIVPDTILEIDQLWGRAALAGDYKRLMQRLDVAAPDRVLAIHLRRRSLGGADVGAFAAKLSAVCTGSGLHPVFLGLGSAHGDDLMARELHQAMTCPSSVLDRPESLREIAALLAWARAYAGSSLHGYVVALAYGRPGVLVARPAYQKFSGLIAHVDRPQDLVGSWDAALEKLGQVPQTSGVPDATLRALDRHWAAVAEALSRPPAHRRAARLAYLRTWFAAGLGTSFGQWAFAPIVSEHDLAAALSGEDMRGVSPL